MTKPGFEPRNIEMKVGRSILFTIRTPSKTTKFPNEKNFGRKKICLSHSDSEKWQNGLC
jgi:hypothetical protein